MQTDDYKVKLISVQDTSTYDISEDFFEVTAYNTEIGDGNDLPIGATAVTVPHKGDYAIYTSGDIDWYRVYLAYGNTYYFENTSEEDYDSAFSLYGPGNSSGSVIGPQVRYSDDHGDSLQPYFEYICFESGYYYLRVSSFSDSKVKEKQYDTGFYTLTIDNDLSGDIYVRNPNGGEVWLMGSGQYITWTDENSDWVNIDLYKDGNFNTVIASSVFNSGSYYWYLPTLLEAGADYKIRVSDSDNHSVNDQSNNFFCIADDVYVNIVGEWYFYALDKQEDQTVTFYSNGTMIYSTGYSSYPGTWSGAGNGVRFDIDLEYGTVPYCIGIVEGDAMNGTWYEGGYVGEWYAYRVGVK